MSREVFFSAFRYHWLYASGAIIGSYKPLMNGKDLHRFYTEWKQRFSHPDIASTE